MLHVISLHRQHRWDSRLFCGSKVADLTGLEQLQPWIIRDDGCLLHWAADAFGASGVIVLQPMH